MAMLAFQAVGAAVGYAFGGPFGAQVGIAVGSYLGGQLGGDQQLAPQQGPRLLDNKVQASTYGKAIAVAYGSVVTAGNVIWSSDIIETAHTETVSSGGGKGGRSGVSQTQTTYSYSVNVAIGICEGPILGIRRIWANGKLIFNVGDDASADTFLASQENALTVYTGSASQIPNSTIEAYEGAGNVPGYRGLAYVVLEDFQLAEYGNRIPNFEFEVCGSGAGSVDITTVFSGTSVNDAYWVQYDTAHMCAPNSGAVWGQWYTGTAYYWTLFDLASGTKTVTKKGTQVGMPNDTTLPTPHGVDAANNCYGYYSSAIYKLTPAGDYYYISPSAGVGTYGIVMSADGSTIYATDASGSGNLNKLTSLNWAAHTCTRTSSSTLFSRFLRNALGIAGRVYGVWSGRIVYADTATLSSTTWPNIGTIDALWGGAVGDDGCVYVATNNSGTRKVGKYDSAGTLLDSVTIANVISVDLVDSNGKVWARTSTGYLYSINPGSMNIEITVNLGASSWEYVVGEAFIGAPAIDQTSAATIDYPAVYEWRYSGALPWGGQGLTGQEAGEWVIAQSQAYTSSYRGCSVTGPGSQVGSIWNWPVSGTCGYTSMNGQFQLVCPSGGTLVGATCVGAPGPSGKIGYLDPVYRLTRSTVELADILSDVGGRCGLSSGDIDVSGVTQDVRGYLISSQVTGRGAIEPLLQAFFVDAVESDNVIKFVPRGSSSAVTIAEDDLAARENDARTPVDVLTRTRRQEVDLPVEVDVQYMAYDNEYQVGQQSARRLTTSSKQIASMQLPVVLTDDEAVRIADATMYCNWTARTEFEFATTREYVKYEPTDVVTVQAKGVSYTVRLIRKDEGTNGVIKWAGVLEDSSVYTQTRTGAAGPTPDGSVASRGTTDYQLLDIPLLRDSEDTVGFYGAAGAAGDGWAGAWLYVSKDGGGSYRVADDEPAVFAAVVGTTSSTLPNKTDGTGSVTVVLSSGTTLASCTDDELIAGSNYALIGAHGRWEVVQFKTATLTATATYRLQDFVRGLRGTDWAIGTHTSADTFVLLDPARMQNIDQLITDWNTQYAYKAVTVGTTLADTTAQNFTNTLVRLKPLAPTEVGGGRDASSNLTIQWIRRTRVYAPLMDYSDAPLGESSEAYEVDIMNGSTVVRTISVSSWSTDTPSTSYSASDQTTDFGSPQSSLTVKVYQLSGTVGRGYAATATI